MGGEMGGRGRGGNGLLMGHEVLALKSCLLSCARPMQGYAHKTHFCAHVTNPQRCTLGESCNIEVHKTFRVCKK
jgi:hypothetical protein